MYACNLCNRSFSTQGSLKRHRESVHRQSVGFSCQVCGQRFYRKDHLGRHMKVHRPAVLVRRNLLGISAGATVDLPPPLPSPAPPESHGERPLCDLFTKSFASQKTLKRHRQTIHRPSGMDGVIRPVFILMTCLLFPVLSQLPVPRGKNRHVNTWIHMYDSVEIKLARKKMCGCFFLWARGKPDRFRFDVLLYEHKMLTEKSRLNKKNHPKPFPPFPERYESAYPMHFFLIYTKDSIEDIAWTLKCKNRNFTSH